MTTQLFHSRVNDVVPWQAQYTFPSQATKMHRQTVKLPPKQGGSFGPGQKIRIEFPSDGYLNAMNSVLSFDLTCNHSRNVSGTVVVTMAGAVATYTLGADIAARATAGTYNGCYMAFRSGALKGQVVKINAQDANAVVTLIDSESFLPVPGTYEVSITSGGVLQKAGAHSLIKSIKIFYGGLAWETIDDYNVLARILLEHGTNPGYQGSVGAIMDGTQAATQKEGVSGQPFGTSLPMSDFASALADTSDKRRFTLNLLSGLMACKKLIPLKWMAAQFVLEIELAQVADAFIVPKAKSLSYALDNVNYIAELYDFDSTYDTAFFLGLRTQGVPIKFSSWRRHTFTLNAKKLVCQVHERARSVKMAFAVIRDQSQSTEHDAHRFFFNAATMRGDGGANNYGTHANDAGSGDCSVKEFQWRIGGKYFPAQPVNCEAGGAEAYVEILKALDGLGDYTFWTNIDRDSFSGKGPQEGHRFIMAQEFEHADISPDTISGINAEEQSDLALTIELQNTPPTTATGAKQIDIFVAYDALVIIRDGNVVDLVL